MSIEAIITSALTALNLPAQKHPFTPDKNNKRPSRYFTYNIYTAGADHADNEPQHEVARIMVHYFCPLEENSVSMERRVKKALSGAGTTYPHKTDASDENGQHIVFECEFAEGVDADG